jgi:WD40 repeat protein
MLSIRCPVCENAFDTSGDPPHAAIECPSCRSFLGTAGEADGPVHEPLPIELASKLVGHTRDVWSVAFAPNGTYLASGSLDGSIRLWDVAEGKLRGRIDAHRGGVLSVAISPDGRWLASGGLDNTVKLWDVATRTRRGQHPRYAGGTVQFSRDGRQLASPSPDGICLWDVASRREAGTLAGDGRNAKALAFTPDGRSLVSGHDTRTGANVRIWDLCTGRCQIARAGHEEVTAVSLSPDGSTLASADTRGLLKLWSVANGTERAALRPLGRSQRVEPSTILAVAFSPSGEWLAASLHLAGGPNVQIWNVRTLEVRAAFEGHRSGVQSIVFSPDGSLMATGGRDGQARLWSIPASS